MGRRKEPRLSPEIVALLASIPEVRQNGDRHTGCQRGGAGKPKQRYASADCARRGAVAFAWQMGADRPSPQTVVYLCRFCDWYHSGRSRDTPIPINAREVVHAAAA